MQRPFVSEIESNERKHGPALSDNLGHGTDADVITAQLSQRSDRSSAGDTKVENAPVAHEPRDGAQCRLL
jgi:hypothetical protein